MGGAHMCSESVRDAAGKSRGNYLLSEALSPCPCLHYLPSFQAGNSEPSINSGPREAEAGRILPHLKTPNLLQEK